MSDRDTLEMDVPQQKAITLKRLSTFALPEIPGSARGWRRDARPVKPRSMMFRLDARRVVMLIRPIGEIAPRQAEDGIAMNYDFIAIPDEDVPRGYRALFQHLVTTVLLRDDQDRGQARPIRRSHANGSGLISGQLQAIRMNAWTCPDVPPTIPA